LDLGKAQDFTALAVLERVRKADPARPDQAVSHYGVRALKRWTLGTSYTVIVAELAGMVSKPPLRGSMLAIDQTGVGMAVVDMVKAAGLSVVLHPILITAGHEISHEGGSWHVPKKELVSVLQVLLQQRRLKIAQLPERELLLKELQAFRVKVTVNANETFESWRERDHDDLVLAVALAAWLAERLGHAGGFVGFSRPMESAEDRAAARRADPSGHRPGYYGQRGWR
jgi:hypothetical protein